MSLFIGLILVSLITVFSTIVTNVIISSVQQSSHVNRANEAFFGAEGALEEGLKFNREKGAGFTLELPATLDFGGMAIEGSGVTQSTTQCYGTTTFEACVDQCEIENPSGGNPYQLDCYVVCENCPASTSGTENSVTPDVKAQYDIQGRVPAGLVYAVGTKYAGKYNVPTPGTGNVGGYCDTLDPPISKSDKHSEYLIPGMEEPFELSDPSEHPCNWNKIKVGETITIPLYFVDNNGDAVPFLQTNYASYSSMIIRMRTPCKDGNDICDKMYRYNLADNPNSNLTEAVPYNDPVVSWQIVTEKTAEYPSYVLSAISDFENSDDEELKSGTSTVILESKINEAKQDAIAPFTVFGLTDSGSFGRDINKCKGTIRQFLLAESGSCWEGKTINKPVLKLSVIGNIISNELDEGKLPFLEYQIITSAFSGDNSPTNSVQTITAEGYSGTFKQVLEVKQPQSGGLLEYVIQQ